VCARKDTSNLSLKMEPEFAPSALRNANHALKVQLNAQVVMLASTELKVMILWAAEHASAGLDIVQLLREDVFNQTANQTNGVPNARLILRFVFNAKPTSTESSSSQNTFVFALMDSLKMPMEHARLALTDVPNAHQQPNATLVWLKLPTTETEHAIAQLEHSLELLQTESDTANHAFNIATSAQTT